MPTTLVGLAIFVTFLTPGFVYLVRTETRLPERRYSLLRETVTIVSVSLAVNGVILGLSRFSDTYCQLSRRMPGRLSVIRVATSRATTQRSHSGVPYCFSLQPALLQ